MSPGPRAWTAEEDAAILDPDKTVRQLAIELGRTESAIKSRRHKRGARVHRIGPKRMEWLIAKTCRECDRLLLAARFHHNGHSWSVRCRDCHALDAHERQGAQQAETLPGATRYRAQWTGAEIELLLREDLTSQQIAGMLGRTLYGVAYARKRARRDPKWVASFRV